MSGYWCVIVVSGELDERFGDAFADLSVRAANGNTGTVRDEVRLVPGDRRSEYLLAPGR
jgi:hypothetical protein